MTRKSSYEVFSQTYKISGNHVTFRALRGFSSSSRYLLERRTCVESVRVRADVLARSCMMTRLVC